MKKAALILLAVCVLMGACAPSTVRHKADYFDGKVVVEVVRNGGGDDYISFAFHSPGIYKVSFSTPALPLMNPGILPEDFSYEFQENETREKVLQVDRIKNHFLVTIDYKGTSETKELQ